MEIKKLEDQLIQEYSKIYKFESLNKWSFKLFENNILNSVSDSIKKIKDLTNVISNKYDECIFHLRISKLDNNKFEAINDLITKKNNHTGKLKSLLLKYNLEKENIEIEKQSETNKKEVNWDLYDLT